MLRYNGGNRVRKGYYWNAENGELVRVRDTDFLPGPEESVFYRIPFPLLFPLALVFGGVYIIVLPLVSLATIIAFAGKVVVGEAFSQFRKVVSFGWRPTEAYLAGKKREGEKTEDGLSGEKRD